MAIRKFDRRNGADAVRPDEQTVTVRYTRPNQPEEILAYQKTVVASVGASDEELAQYMSQFGTFVEVSHHHVPGKVPPSWFDLGRPR